MNFKKVWCLELSHGVGREAPGEHRVAHRLGRGNPLLAAVAEHSLEQVRSLGRHPGHVHLLGGQIINVN